MAKIGLSKPYFSVYSASGSTVTYSGGGLIGKYTEMNINVDGGNDNILYADNAATESDKSFGGGSFTMSTDNLDATVMATILGLASESISATGVTTEGAAWKIWNDSQAVPYLGIGGVIKKKIGGVDKWVGFVLDKVQFNNPSIAAITQGETIDWQTQELTANIMRSDATSHGWFRMTTDLASEAEAEAAVKDYLDIT